LAKNIEVIARGVFVVKNRVLLCHTKGKGNTYLPGGHVDFGESAENAVKREIKEELGCKTTVLRYLGTVEHAYDDKSGRTAEINLIFEVNIDGISDDENPASKEDYIEFLWWDLRNLKKAMLEPAVMCDMLLAWLSEKKDVSRWTSSIANANKHA